MGRSRFLVVVPLAGIVTWLGWSGVHPRPFRDGDGRIATPKLAALEAEMGTHLYAPTWLPEDGHPGKRDALRGARRVIQDFETSSGRLVLLAQEPRTAIRDAYHQRLFMDRWEARADVNGRVAYFVNGSSGERRLFWNTADFALILSSSHLSDDELITIARRIR